MKNGKKEQIASAGLLEILRIRLEKWRIIYSVNDYEKWAWVLTIRRRPPYAYEDLAELMEKLNE